MTFSPSCDEKGLVVCFNLLATPVSQYSGKEDLKLFMLKDKMTVVEMRTELLKLKESLCDIEDVHAFTFVKTSVHIGAEKAQAMQEEYDEECRGLRNRIEELERRIKEKESAGSA